MISKRSPLSAPAFATIDVGAATVGVSAGDGAMALARAQLVRKEGWYFAAVLLSGLAIGALAFVGMLLA